MLYNKRYTSDSAGQSLTRVHVSEQLRQTEEAKKKVEGMSVLSNRFDTTAPGGATEISTLWSLTHQYTSLLHCIFF